MIVTMGGRFGGYGLYLSKSFNWWLYEGLLKAAGWGLFVVGLLLTLLGRYRKWSSGKRRVGHVTLAGASLLLLAVFATGLFGIGKGRPEFVYNLLDLKRFVWQGSAISPGKHAIVFDFKYDGPGPGKGGTGVLSVDGKELARKTIPHSVPLTMTFFETFDVGVDTRTPVDESYELPFRFTGTLNKLTIKPGPSQLSEPKQAVAAEAITKAKD